MMMVMMMSSSSDQMLGTVSLKNISVGTSGVYQCTASNAIGTSTCQLNLQVVTRESRLICLSVTKSMLHLQTFTGTTDSIKSC